MHFTYYGHSCFLIETNGIKILFDPFISPNELAKGKVDINTIECNYIAISHGHFDHVADVENIAQRTNATIICAYELYEYFSKKGLKNFRPMNVGGKWTTDFGSVKCVNAVHSSNLPDGSYGANAMGFVFNTKEGDFYYSGDTALTMDMQLIPRWANLKFAVLPIGDNFTMDVEDAITAADFVQCNKVIGVHYDTFGFIVINHDEAKEKFTKKEKELLLLNIGETINL
ncbi:MAG TPA: metal-dependent hydrolase [Chitinophagales bacterium]|jgi:L-ascorbate metabolism protein UlaG (beta-lactamase superfamily)|nr:metal-dependent hydrolase [Chitinophagales bacterium]MBP6154671.1 metal-dependent hydrolase [Chitinophagales bacterium]HQV77486.1 metal-dependent hydrolase [Chitinophagales bacterium]HQW78548.1 metal-dependent hydrolase [Chitinophagales bacterium]HRB19241.1 metal-dependent hydrolase [Chitinophagales bacterium]